MALANYALTTTPSIIYQSTGNSVVSVMYFCNTTASAIGISLFLVPSGGVAATTTNMAYDNVIIAAGDTFVIDTEKLILSNGDMIAGSATATGILVSWSYIDY